MLTVTSPEEFLTNEAPVFTIVPATLPTIPPMVDVAAVTALFFIVEVFLVLPVSGQ